MSRSNGQLERRHFAALAAAIASGEHPFASASAKQAFLWDLCAILEKTNPGFNRIRFLNAACGAMSVESCFPSRN